MYTILMKIIMYCAFVLDDFLVLVDFVLIPVFSLIGQSSFGTIGKELKTQVQSKRSFKFSVKLHHFPRFRGENQNVRNSHLLGGMIPGFEKVVHLPMVSGVFIIS